MFVEGDMLVTTGLLMPPGAVRGSCGRRLSKDRQDEYILVRIRVI